MRGRRGLTRAERAARLAAPPGSPCPVSPSHSPTGLPTSLARTQHPCRLVVALLGSRSRLPGGSGCAREELCAEEPCSGRRSGRATRGGSVRDGGPGPARQEHRACPGQPPQGCSALPRSSARKGSAPALLFTGKTHLGGLWFGGTPACWHPPARVSQRQLTLGLQKGSGIAGFGCAIDEMCPKQDVTWAGRAAPVGTLMWLSACQDQVRKDLADLHVPLRLSCYLSTQKKMHTSSASILNLLLSLRQWDKPDTAMTVRRYPTVSPAPAPSSTRCHGAGRKPPRNGLPEVPGSAQPPAPPAPAQLSKEEEKGLEKSPACCLSYSHSSNMKLFQEHVYKCQGKVKAVSFLLPMDMSSFAEKQGSLKSPQNQSTKHLMTITEKDM
ncbi:uncharacterized protein LOC111933550 [Cyanistes caeruleus]|uniref:uncharacterized protein LOC111933550 n=1 Tax=Cyanistes caeruleus TaxID=156563 RepID=UPI000CDA331F|nr:uncharacterized protein LOC111933550 [Cyanistes caeruleus]